MLKRIALRIADIGLLVLPLLIVAGLVAAYLMLVGLRELVPPRNVTMAAGRPDGGYYQIALQYQSVLARDGITLNILDTAGSVENAALLADGTANVALLQGGVPVDPTAGIEALAAVFLEPLFIFYRGDRIEDANPSEWTGLRVTAGEAGSGTRKAIESLEKALGLDFSPATFLPIGGTAAAEALMRGDADVAVFVAPVTAPYLRPLLTDPRIRLSSPRDSEALSRRLTFVREADIPPATLDYTQRLPPERVELTAMIATLVARDDLHPALVNRFVRAAQEIHSGPTLLSASLRFPMAHGTELPMNPQAETLLTSGPGALDRTLPYWVAAQITRVTILLVPLLVLLVPLMRVLPGLYEWRMRARVYRRYNELVTIDAEAEGPLSDDRRIEMLRELDVIDRDIKEVQVPPKYREYAYTLRLHIDLVRRKLLDADRA